MVQTDDLKWPFGIDSFMTILEELFCTVRSELHSFAAINLYQFEIECIIARAEQSCIKCVVSQGVENYIIGKPSTETCGTSPLYAVIMFSVHHTTQNINILLEIIKNIFHKNPCFITKLFLWLYPIKKIYSVCLWNNYRHVSLLLRIAKQEYLIKHLIYVLISTSTKYETIHMINEIPQ